MSFEIPYNTPMDDNATTYDDIGFAKLDTDRPRRTGRAEVVFGIGKTPEQVAEILKRLSETSPVVVATKVTQEQYEAAEAAIAGGAQGDSGLTSNAGGAQGDSEPIANAEGAQGDSRSIAKVLAWHETAKLLVVRNAGAAGGEEQCEEKKDSQATKQSVAVVCGGTADIPIAEEAAIAAEIYGADVRRFYDVGVAGIHRLLDRAEEIRRADVVIAVAGMEGALPSVVAGLVAVPVIAVPTSVGYGSSMGGLTALLAMLNSCSLGISVVNIDNGFGAGYLASLILQPRFCNNPEIPSTSNTRTHGSTQIA